MKRDINVSTLEQLAALCILLTEAGYGFEARENDNGGWTVRLSGAF